MTNNMISPEQFDSFVKERIDLMRMSGEMPAPYELLLTFTNEQLISIIRNLETRIESTEIQLSEAQEMQCFHDE